MIFFFESLFRVLTEFFGNSCAFCGETRDLARHSRICNACIDKLRRPVLDMYEQHLNGLQIYSLFKYDDWVRRLILTNKRNGSDLMVHWCAERLENALRALGCTPESTQIVWIPSHPRSEIHITEALALQLATRGYRLPLRIPLIEASGILKKWPKLHQTTHRAQRAPLVAQRYRSSGPISSPSVHPPTTVLLDDVCTTGTTLIHIKDLLLRSGFPAVTFAMTLAFTPDRHSK